MNAERMEPIKVSRLRELEKKERAHDDYLEAMRRLRAENARLDLLWENRDLAAGLGDVYLMGRRDALRDLSQYIVDVGNERPVPHG